ncbi:hypothetical protein [Aquimarina sediminis]|uniref:hypothetical protein n=1 Tax=Aquimarina sediminis TaxID=2070536 RepID=UPI000CA03243|nr:hypothetical protein [Aquimarina sediminis]
MKTSRKYTRELYRQFKYLATWLPGTPLALGDIGLMRGREFTKIGNLSDDKFKVDFDIEYDKTPSSISHSSKGAVTLTAKLSGTVSPSYSTLTDLDAGFNVSFSKENAILFKANGTYNHSIKDQIKLGDTILDLYKNGKWDKDYVIITELVVADSSTILISSEKNGAIDIRANGNIGTSALDIADGSLELGATFSKGLSTELISKKGLTPLFKVSKIKTPFLSSPIFEVSKIRSYKMMEDNYSPIDNDINYFAEVTFDDVDDFEV